MQREFQGADAAREVIRRRPRFLRLAAALALAFWASAPLAVHAQDANPKPAATQQAPDQKAEQVKPAHGIAMHGDLKYPPGFKHFDYANPDAPKGGAARFIAIGTYDSLNPFILRGVPATASALPYDTLMTSAGDEPFSQYGVVAETVEMPSDRSWVIFNLRKEARFHDGAPITADDVIFTFDLIRAKGHPQLRFYYASIAKVEKLGPLRVKFTFKEGDNREMPLIVGEQAILPKHYWEGRDFERTTLEPPLGSGPYRVESLEPGRSITYRRVTDYWGRDLPVAKGRFNFDTIRYDYYRDATVAVEAFRAGQYDLREENSAKTWATEYDFPAVRRKLVIKEEIPTQTPSGMQAFIFNTRRPVFADRRVREAIGYGFDFEWTNRNLFNGAYTRTDSYFENSELEATGLPEGEELKLLERYRDRLPQDVFTKEPTVPTTDGSGNVRDNLLTALRLMESAGWRVRPKDGVMIDANGEPVAFEVVLVNPQFERIVGPFARNLRRLGIQVDMRTVDTSQFQNRVDNRDFDMIVGGWGQSLSPGNEQRSYWTSESADVPGSQNYAGIKDPVIDELVDLVIAAPDRNSLVARTRALDRVLRWGHYVVPHYHVRVDRIVYWNKFGRPKITPFRGYQPDTWWIDAAKEAVVSRGKAEMSTEVADESGTEEPIPKDRRSPWLYGAGGAAALLLIFAVTRLRRRKAEDSPP